MISWIVASHDLSIFDANLRPTLPAEDELILVEGAPSIAVAYNEGQARSTQPIRCYIHHDVQILDQAALRQALAEACAYAGVDVVGVIGSRTRVIPWWIGEPLGSVKDSRLGLINFGPGGPCSYLDVLLLASARELEWDESYPGWHGYDHDICEQTMRRSRVNFCLSGGHNLVSHNATSSTDMNQVNGWFAAEEHYFRKWVAE